MVFASRLVTPRGKFAAHKESYFFVGADTEEEFTVFVATYGIEVYALLPGLRNKRYMALQRWCYRYVIGLVDEVVKVSEFDRRICSSGGGIPTVSSKGLLDGTATDQTTDDTDNTDRGD